jgi:GT2 family glycosyltransferase
MIDQITVCTPFEPGRKLAYAYNRAMEQAPTEWVLLLDWDLFNCNPYWYDMCLYAVNNVEKKTGWITCVTNRIGAPQQRAPGCPESHDVVEHIEFSRKLFEKTSKVDGNGVLTSTRLERIPGALSGFFILTNKTAWRACGGFRSDRDRLRGVDNRYSKMLSKAGYRLYYIPGLYFYHIHGFKNTIWCAKGAGFYGNRSK